MCLPACLCADPAPPQILPPRPGIPKLDDANDAGTRNSEHCTLILTEGDSAKTLAIAGLSVVGRDRYGVFPLRCGPVASRELRAVCRRGGRREL